MPIDARHLLGPFSQYRSGGVMNERRPTPAPPAWMFSQVESGGVYDYEDDPSKMSGSAGDAWEGSYGGGSADMDAWSKPADGYGDNGPTGGSYNYDPGMDAWSKPADGYGDNGPAGQEPWMVDSGYGTGPNAGAWSDPAVGYGNAGPEVWGMTEPPSYGSYSPGSSGYDTGAGDDPALGGGYNAPVGPGTGANGTGGNRSGYGRYGGSQTDPVGGGSSDLSGTGRQPPPLLVASTGDRGRLRGGLVNPDGTPADAGPAARNAVEKLPPGTPARQAATPGPGGGAVPPGTDPQLARDLMNIEWNARQKIAQIDADVGLDANAKNQAIAQIQADTEMGKQGLLNQQAYGGMYNARWLANADTVNRGRELGLQEGSDVRKTGLGYYNTTAQEATRRWQDQLNYGANIAKTLGQMNAAPGGWMDYWDTMRGIAPTGQISASEQQLSELLQKPLQRDISFDVAAMPDWMRGPVYGLDAYQRPLDIGPMPSWMGQGPAYPDPDRGPVSPPPGPPGPPAPPAPPIVTPPAPAGPPAQTPQQAAAGNQPAMPFLPAPGEPWGLTDQKNIDMMRPVNDYYNTISGGKEAPPDLSYMERPLTPEQKAASDKSYADFTDQFAAQTAASEWIAANARGANLAKTTAFMQANKRPPTDRAELDAWQQPAPTGTQPYTPPKPTGPPAAQPVPSDMIPTRGSVPPPPPPPAPVAQPPPPPVPPPAASTPLPPIQGLAGKMQGAYDTLLKTGGGTSIPPTDPRWRTLVTQVSQMSGLQPDQADRLLMANREYYTVNRRPKPPAEIEAMIAQLRGGMAPPTAGVPSTGGGTVRSIFA